MIILIIYIFRIWPAISKYLIDFLMLLLIDIDIFGCLDLSIVVDRKYHIID